MLRFHKFEVGDKVIRIATDEEGIIKSLGDLYGYFSYEVEFPGDGSYWLYEEDLSPVVKRNVSGCECGNKQNPRGQGHSDWCRLFKQEF